MRRIFISHSTDKTDEDGKAYVRQLARGLTDAKFEVFLDLNSLDGGDDWSFKIANHLGYCQGAVVLLSERALASRYVFAEASDLFFKRERGGRTPAGSPVFPLVPVFVTRQAMLGAPGAGAAEQQALDTELRKTTGYWHALGLTAVQVSSAATVSDLVAHLVKAFDHLLDVEPEGPLGELEIKIGDIVQRAEGMVKLLAREADPALPPTIGADKAGRCLARTLLTSTLPKAHDYLTRFGGALDKEHVRSVFHLIAPSWVSPQAAIALYDVLERKRPESCVVVNASLVAFTPLMYMCRARTRLPDDVGLIVPVERLSTQTPSADLYGAVLNRLAETLHCDVDADDAQSLQRLQEALQAERAFQPVVIVVPVSASEIDTLVKLSGEPEFKGATFLAMCEDALPAVSAGLVKLEPALQEGRETRAEDTYTRVKDKLYPEQRQLRRSA